MVVSPGFAEPTAHFASFVRTKLKTVHIFSCVVKLLRLISVPSGKILNQRFYLLLNPTDGTFICSFLNNLDQNDKILYYFVETSIMIRRFVSSAVAIFGLINFLSRRPLGWLNNSSEFCYFCNLLVFILHVISLSLF